MPESEACILVLNGGSSSIKFALYGDTPALQERFRGSVDSSGAGSARLTVKRATGVTDTCSLQASDSNAVPSALVQWIGEQVDLPLITAAGHRIVFGMQHVLPQFVTPSLLNDLRNTIPCDPDHLPGQLALIEALQHQRPELAQVVCFDTHFHAEMPRVARLLPIPRRYEARGVKRYGFHGLSYAFVMSELLRVGDAAAQHGRVVLAHLGGGASVCAVREGRSIDTTMGFTPSSGLMMGTRAGDVDPSLPGYLARSAGVSLETFEEMVQHESGLLGVSETSADMRELLAHAADDVRAEEAVSMFCYQVKKYIGAYAAALGGIDTLVFSGGIGEHAAEVRARICSDLNFLGVTLSAERNTQGDDIISAADSAVTVRVVRTNEELMIARAVRTLQQ